MRLAVPLATAVLTLTGAAAHAQPPQPDRLPTVTASGKATVKRAPDRAFYE